MIRYQDFAKIDIRIGTIIQVRGFPQAIKPAWQLKIDFGEIGIKSSSAQLTDLYSPDDLLGKQVMAVVNFPVKQIANFFSECLVLGFPNKEGLVILAGADKQVPNGARLF